jgi:hypothetical protein
MFNALVEQSIAQSPHPVHSSLFKIGKPSFLDRIPFKNSRRLILFLNRAEFKFSLSLQGRMFVRPFGRAKFHLSRWVRSAAQGEPRAGPGLQAGESRGSLFSLAGNSAKYFSPKRKNNPIRAKIPMDMNNSIGLKGKEPTSPQIPSILPGWKANG